jgi:hypothetical protein
MKGMDHGRKEAMCRRMNELDNPSLAAAASGKNCKFCRDAPLSSSGVPSFSFAHQNNRRVRMRAKKTTALDYKRSPLPQSINSTKSHLDKVPFWREGGSIASLLFENRLPSSGAEDNRHPMGRKSLEVRLFTYSNNMFDSTREATKLKYHTHVRHFLCGASECSCCRLGESTPSPPFSCTYRALP